MKQPCLILSLTLLAAIAGCQPAPQQHAFIERLGNDTISMEVYTHTDSYVEGSIVTRNPVTRVARYRAELGNDLIRRLEVQWSTPAENPEGPGPESAVITFHGDSVTLVQEGGRNAGTTTVAAPANTFPLVGVSPYAYGIMEQIATAALDSGEEEFQFNTVRAGSPRVSSNAVRQLPGDTISTDYFGSPMLATFSGAHIAGRSGRETSMRIEGEPIEPVAIEMWAAEFAARDARNEGLGVPSPGATVQVSVAGASLEVVYSQPAKRGREIWGGLVAYDEVWRTGANAATHFTTDRNLMIAGQRVPAGTYTLWSTFTADTAMLIINSQTGQWGTQYDASRDFVRVPLTAGALAEPVERFTISIEAQGRGAVLSLSWDRTSYTVPIVVR